jgi:uncharacterized membrane protein YgcG
MRRIALLGVALLLGLQAPLRAAAQDSSGPPPLNNEQLDALVAPIALYPDDLLAQILMASTYPLEIVEAARWAKANPKVTGDALETAMQKQSWDASVKSLTAFPQVLTMMDSKLDWTQKLGDAFLAQQKDVMSAVQRLRAKAKNEGNLESNEQQKVVVEEAPPGSSTTTIIQVQPANPEVVYVPTYNPTVVYGAWPYPSYPPYSYYPPGYLATSMISFGVGMAVGSALWGNCNWGAGNVDVNVNNYNNFNRTNISNKNWQHNSEHRRGVQYRDKATGQRYGRDTARRDQSRDAFRGRAEQGRRDLARSGADGRGAGARDRSAGSVGSQRARADGARREASRGGGVERSGRRDSASAFQGMGNGRDVRRQSDRGRASRQSASSWGGRGGGGGYQRGGGGGGGGFGGRGGGGGGRRGR